VSVFHNQTTQYGPESHNLNVFEFSLKCAEIFEKEHKSAVSEIALIHAQVR
jgi:hypothetical protein